MNNSNVLANLSGMGLNVDAINERGEVIKNIQPWPDGHEPFGLDDLPAYVNEKDDPSILIRGRWLERGGSAWIVSTAGTGKSIHAMQMAFCLAASVPFSGLVPNRKLNVWIFQTEDSKGRLTIDRDGVLAELSETHPAVNWKKETKNRIRFFPVGGAGGVEFVKLLRELLANARHRHELPDVVVLNPFMAFIGGPVNDGSYVTPFLRGGVICGTYTEGLQAVLEEFAVGALIYHHTPKPPSPKEIEAWMANPLPEYQGAGSADITNWGRSFISMMKAIKDPRVVMLTAGKNGADLGWIETDGARRHYLHWSDKEGYEGHGRHAWRELTPEELEAVAPATSEQLKENVTKIVESCINNSWCSTTARVKRFGLKKSDYEAAWKEFTASFSQHGIRCWEVQIRPGIPPARYYGKNADQDAFFSARRSGVETPVVREVFSCPRSRAGQEGQEIFAPLKGGNNISPLALGAGQVETPDPRVPPELVEDPMF